MTISHIRCQLLLPKATNKVHYKDALLLDHFQRENDSAGRVVERTHDPFDRDCCSKNRKTKGISNRRIHLDYLPAQNLEQARLRY